MRLRERKHVSYNEGGADEIGEDCTPQDTSDLEDLPTSDVGCFQESGKLDHKRSLGDRKRERNVSVDNGLFGSFHKRRPSTEENTFGSSFKKQRFTRFARINYKEESEVSSMELEDESEDSQSSSSSAMSNYTLSTSCGELGSPEVSEEDDVAWQEQTALDRHLVESADIRKVINGAGTEDVSQIECSAALHEAYTEPLSSLGNHNEHWKCIENSKTLPDFNNASVDAEKKMQECNIDTFDDSPFQYYALTYSRRKNTSKRAISISFDGTLKDWISIWPTVEKKSEQLELKVDEFGPYRDKNEIRSIVKRVGQVEKIISVGGRHSESAVYCVKLSGKSYRNCVYVYEQLLLKNYPQLLRNFWKRMDELDRVDGNLGEKLGYPAFNPSYIQVDRIIGAEQRGRKKYYFVKWCGLPYSESTWESEDVLASEKRALKRFAQISARGAPTSSTATFKDGRILRDYQKKGVAWIDRNYQKKVNCILADEMGLGKTIQSVAMLQNLRVKWKVKGPFLVVAPVSTLGHWQREIESLTNMNCLVYAGSAEDRAIMKEYEFLTLSKNPELKFNVLLTGYEVLMRDHHFLAKQEWKYIIVDEAHRLKTKDSKTVRTLREMSIKKGGLLLLTGTPVQNNTREIFSLLNILDPDQFDSEEEFLLKYGDIKNIEQVRDLQENVLKPRLLRRMKEDVEKTIPLKEETIIWVELTHDQRSCYRAIYENRIGDLLKGSQSSNLPNLRNVAMELRKVCNHPFLCDGLEEHLKTKSCQGALTDQRDEVLCKILCQSSGKMLLLDKLLPMLKDAGRRVLIFSQFTMMLDLLEDYLNVKGYAFERIDGKIRGSERQAAIDRYSAHGSESFVFLLSTRAGGLGITLTAADTCIIYDSDWNPQNDLQAMARCHRIGQTKDVRIYRLITRNTYEQHLFECSSKKYGLDEAILGNNLGSSVDIEHTKNIESLLKRGAYGMLKDDGEADATAFHAQNIEQILEQRTQKRLIGGRANNTFSVATFISNDEEESYETYEFERMPLFSKESSDFWQELLPEACQAASTGDMPKIPQSTGPRKRAEVNYKERGEMSGEDTSEEEEEQEEKDSPKGRKLGTRYSRDIEDSTKQWSEKEFKRLETRLMMLGKDREEQIMIESELEHHGFSQVKQLITVLIQFCHYFLQKETNVVPVSKGASSGVEDAKTDAGDMKAFGAECHNRMNATEGDCQITLKPVNDGAFLVGKDMQSKLHEDTKGLKLNEDFQDKGKEPKKQFDLPEIPDFATRVLTSSHCMLRLQKNASRYLQMLHERDVLSKALADSSFTPVVIPKSKKLPLWWGDIEDLHLMQGALKHGQKEFMKIREDPDFCFVARRKSRMNASNQQTMQEGYAIKCEDGENLVQDGELAEDDWPHDSVLTMRLKKLIEALPNGLSNREIKRRAAVAEAARKRWAKLGQGSWDRPVQDFKNIQMGFIVYIDGMKYAQSELRYAPQEKAIDMDCQGPIDCRTSKDPETRTPIDISLYSAQGNLYMCLNAEDQHEQPEAGGQIEKEL